MQTASEDADLDQRLDTADGFSVWSHLLALAVVLILFGSLMGPLSSIATVRLAVVIAGLGVVRALAVHGAIAWRTVLMAALLALVVGFRAYLDPPTSAYGQMKWTNFCTLTSVTMATAAAVTSRRTVHALAMWWVIAGVVLAGLALLDPAAGSGRAQVEGSNPVWLGRAIAASMVIGVWIGVTRIWRWWRLTLVLPILAAGLLATGSRGPALAAAVGIVVLLLAPTARRSKQVLWLVVLVMGFVFAAPFVPALSNSRFGQFVTDVDVTGESRSAMWLTAARTIPDHPWGVGLGDWAPATMSRFDWPHNIFLEVFVEQGWLVGGCLVVLVFAVFRGLWRNSGSDPVLQLAVALLATETIHVSTSGDLNARTFFFVLLFGVGQLNKQRFIPALSAPETEDVQEGRSSQRSMTDSRTLAMRVDIARRD